MKPKDWDQLPMEDRIDIGTRLQHSLRGRYIIGQALAVAIQTMKKVPMPHREVSNIQDMEILREICYTLPCQQDIGPEMMQKMRMAYAGAK
jgi:hypothetical protein